MTEQFYQTLITPTASISDRYFSVFQLKNIGNE